MCKDCMKQAGDIMHGMASNFHFNFGPFGKAIQDMGSAIGGVAKGIGRGATTGGVMNKIINKPAMDVQKTLDAKLKGRAEQRLRTTN